MTKLIGDLKTMVAQWHYYKDEIRDMLALKVNIEDVPTKTSNLNNDVPYITRRDLREVENAINGFEVTFDKNTGILTFKMPRISDNE